MYEWRITRIRSTPAALIGHVEAPDAEQAKRAGGSVHGVDRHRVLVRKGYVLNPQGLANGNERM
jgi:hypothetical protein